MFEIRRRLLNNLFRVADLVVMIVAFLAAFVIAGKSMQVVSLLDYFAVRIKVANFVFFSGWVITWHLVMKAFGLYDSHQLRNVTAAWWTISKAVGVGTLLLSFVAVLLRISAINAVFLVIFFFVTSFGTICSRVIVQSFFSDSRNNGGSLRRLAIVGCGPRGAHFGSKIRQRPGSGYLFLGYIDEMPPPENPLHGGPEKILGPSAEIRRILEDHRIDEIVITLPIASHYQTISNVIQACEELAVDVLMPTDFFRSRLTSIVIEESRSWPALTLKSRIPSVGASVVKRLLDVIVSAVALVILSPMFVVIAVAIKVDSRGSVFFRQRRVGLRRRVFKMHKFRTMHPDAEQRIAELEALNEVDGAAFKMADDPRVTRVGKTLRKLSLDELPQFIDILRGSMSLVGPRPLPIRDVEKFDKVWQKRRFSVKPGLTCLWQVSGRHEVDFENWMELDLEYIDNWSLALDFDILLKTVPAVLRGNGAS